MGNKPDAIVLLSGGIDSAACAAFLAAQGMRVTAVFVDHGQAAAKLESAAVSAIAVELSIEVQRLAFCGADHFGAGEVTGRNGFLVFAALLAAHAHSGVIALGLHAGTPYYDCSPAFLEIINRIVAEYTDNRVQVIAPFIDWTKQDVFDYFVMSGLDIGRTYSCERGESPTCGYCASCLDRKALGC